MTNVLCLSLKPLASSSSKLRGSVQLRDEGSPGPALGEGIHTHTGSRVQATGQTHTRTDLESHSRTDFQLVLDRPPLSALLFNL